jgi:predicted permease
MRLLAELVSRIRSLIWWRREDADLEEEIRFHLEKELEKNVATGMSEREAGRRARLRLGGVEQVKERTRRARGLNLFDEIRRNLAQSVRQIRATRLLSLTAILTLAVGVALTATAYSVVYAILLRPLPFPDSNRLVAVDLIRADGSAGRPQFEALDLRDFRERQRSLESMGGYFQRTVSVIDADAYARGVTGTFVTASALDVLGVAPSLGRAFRQGEDFTDDIRHAVIGYALWQDRYAGRDDAIGATIRVDGRDLEVIGVMPAGFSFPGGEELWLPMDFDLPTTERGSGRSFSVLGRLNDGVSIEAANAEAAIIAAGIAEENPGYFPPLSAKISPFAERYLPVGITRLLYTMLAAVVGVLLIACANVSGLLLTRALIRRTEVSVRLALGATRSRIVFQFLVEALVLSIVGCLSAFGLSAVATRGLKRLLVELPLPEWVDVSLALPALYVIAALIVAVTIATGVFPALRLARTDVASTLGDRSQSSVSRKMRRTGSILVSGQIALSCALLIGAGLLILSVVQVRDTDMGYDASGVLTARLQLPAADHVEPIARSALFADILERTSAIPGVSAASVARGLPGTGPTFSWMFEVRGESYESGIYPEADGMPVAHGYFETMSVELHQGRDFTRNESRFGGTPAVIVNETLARRHLGPNAVGRQIRIGGGDEQEPWLTVVGVVEDTRIGSSSGGIGMDPAAREQVYISWGVAPYSTGTLLVSSDGDPMQLVSGVRGLVHDAAPSAPVYAVARLSDVIRDSTWAFGLFSIIFTTFGAIALILSAVGLYGVIAFGADERRAEMSLRMALGAHAGAIVRLILTDVGKRLACGIGIGVAMGIFVGRSLQSVLFGVEPVDPFVYTLVLVTVAGAGLAAGILPAYRAAGSDPAASLGRQ